MARQEIVNLASSGQYDLSNPIGIAKARLSLSPQDYGELAEYHKLIEESKNMIGNDSGYQYTGSNAPIDPNAPLTSSALGYTPVAQDEAGTFRKIVNTGAKALDTTKRIVAGSADFAGALVAGGVDDGVINYDPAIYSDPELQPAYKAYDDIYGSYSGIPKEKRDQAYKDRLMSLGFDEFDVFARKAEAESYSRLNDLVDSFIAGDISEDKYISEAKKRGFSEFDANFKYTRAKTAEGLIKAGDAVSDTINALPTGYDPKLDTTVADIKNSESALGAVGNSVKFGAEQIPAGIASVILAKKNPQMLYTGISGMMARDNAKNLGSDYVSAENLSNVAGASVASAVLDKASLGIMTKVKGVSGVVLSGLSEAGTEGAQEVIEYAGSINNTPVAFDPNTAVDNAIGGALGGFGTAVTVNTTSQILQNMANKANSNTDDLPPDSPEKLLADTTKVFIPSTNPFATNPVNAGKVANDDQDGNPPAPPSNNNTTNPTSPDSLVAKPLATVDNLPMLSNQELAELSTTNLPLAQSIKDMQDIVSGTAGTPALRQATAEKLARLLNDNNLVPKQSTPKPSDPLTGGSQGSLFDQSAPINPVAPTSSFSTPTVQPLEGSLQSPANDAGFTAPATTNTNSTGFNFGGGSQTIAGQADLPANLNTPANDENVPADAYQATIPTVEVQTAGSDQQAFELPQVSSTEVVGKPSKVVVLDEKQPTTLKVVEADDLMASIFGTDNQFRDRNRDASVLQVGNIAQKLDPDQLQDSPVLFVGAPTLLKNGNEVMAGNGRLQAIQKAYDIGNGDIYKADLIAKAQDYGIDPSAVANMKRPVLVRQLNNDIRTDVASIASNEDTSLAMSALEQARADAVRLPNIDNLKPNENGTLNNVANRGIIANFVSALPINARADLIDANGLLSKRGEERFNNAILYKAYGDTKALADIIDSADPDLKNILKALVRVAPKVAVAKAGMKAGTVVEGDISADITEALVKLQQLRANGTTVDDYLSTDALFQEFDISPVARDLIKFLDENIRSLNKVTQLLGNYYDNLNNLGNPKQPSLDGTAPTSADTQQLLNQTIEEQQRETAKKRGEQPSEASTDLFNETATRPDSQSNQGSIDQPNQSNGDGAGVDANETAVTDSTVTNEQTLDFEPEPLSIPDEQAQAVRDEYEGTDEWLKAPNGNPTNLTEEQWVQTRTPNFKAWFGDWQNNPQNASKVLDENGEPKIVYHGTGFNFTKFSGDQFTWVSYERMLAKGYAGNSFDYETGTTGVTVMPLFSNVKQPFNADKLSQSTSATKFVNELFRQADYKSQGFSLEDKKEIIREVNNYKKSQPISTDTNVPTHYFWHSADILLGVEGKNFLNSVMFDLGYDGISFTERDTKTVGAFTPNQVKSATDNNGEFSSENDDIRYSQNPNDDNVLFSKPPNAPDLVVAHNLSAENLIEADKLGGLSAPSIAVVRTGVSDFTDFGEITLLGKSSLLDGNNDMPTFDADIYSPRQPRAIYDVDADKYYNYQQNSPAKAIGLQLPSVYGLDTSEGKRRFVDNTAVQYDFLKSIGKAPRAYKIKLPKAVAKAVKDSTVDVYDRRAGSKFLELAKQYAEQELKEAVDNFNARVDFKAKKAGVDVNPDDYTTVDSLRRAYFEDDGSVKDYYLNQFENEIFEARNNKDGFDTSRLARDVSKRMRNKKLSQQQQEWAGNQFDEMVTGMRLATGRGKTKPYNLNNVVRAMTAKLQGGEGFYYGLGSIRSVKANKLNTLNEMRASKEKIVSSEDFEKAKVEAGKKFEDIVERLRPFYTGDEDTSDLVLQDEIGKAIMQGGRELRETLNINAKSRAIISELENYLANMPTKYFEAKAQRAVDIGEFDTAVVPSTINPKALEILEQSGLKIKTYNPKKPATRNKVVDNQTDLLFSKTPNKNNSTDEQDLTVGEVEEALVEVLGKTRTDAIDIVTNDPNSQGAEGSHNRTTGKTVVYLDNIQPFKDRKGNVVLTRKERAIWVAWHEAFHRGMSVLSGDGYRGVLKKASKNKFIYALSDKLMEIHGYSRGIALEEALAETRSAIEMDRMDSLATQYGIKTPALSGVRKVTNDWVVTLRNIIRKLTFDKMREVSDSEIVSLVKSIGSVDTSNIDSQLEFNQLNNTDSDTTSTTSAKQPKPKPQRKSRKQRKAEARAEAQRQNNPVLQAQDTGATRIIQGNVKYKALSASNDGRYVIDPDTLQSTSPSSVEAEAVRDEYEGTDEWLKAPNGNPTNLTEEQWVQTRTPSFKNWFGDWENDPENASQVVDENGEPKVVYHGSFDNITEFSEDYAGDTTGNNDYGAFYFSDEYDVAEDYSRQSLLRRYDGIEDMDDVDEIVSQYDLDEASAQQIIDDGIDNYIEDKLNVISAFLNARNLLVDDTQQGDSLDLEKTQRQVNFVKNWEDENYEFSDYVDSAYEQSDLDNFREEIDQRARENYDLEPDEEIEDYQLEEATQEVMEENYYYPEPTDFDGVAITQVIDDIGYASNMMQDEYIVINPNQIKSATDNNGNFSPYSDDIRNSMPPATIQMDEIKDRYQGTTGYLKAPNGADSNLNERQWLETRTESFKAWFGDWEADPASASKVLDENGEPLVVYHGTPTAELNVFDLDFVGGNSGDKGFYGSGIYVSKSESEAQEYGTYTMSLYANVKNPYHFNTTADWYVNGLGDVVLMNELTKNAYQFPDTYTYSDYVQEMEALAEDIGEQNPEYSPYKAKNEATTVLEKKYKHPSIFGRDLKTYYTLEDLGSELATAKLKELGYDGATGKSTLYYNDKGADEIVLFDINQVKSAEFNTGEFSTTNDDIRYSLRPTTTIIPRGRSLRHETWQVLKNNGLRASVYHLKTESEIWDNILTKKPKLVTAFNMAMADTELGNKIYDQLFDAQGELQRLKEKHGGQMAEVADKFRMVNGKIQNAVVERLDPRLRAMTKLLADNYNTIKEAYPEYAGKYGEAQFLHDLDMIGKYVKHGKERNLTVFINSKGEQDNGSGKTDAEIDELIAYYQTRPELIALYEELYLNHIKPLLDMRNDILLDGNLITQEMVDAQYDWDWYVPLQGEPTDVVIDPVTKKVISDAEKRQGKNYGGTNKLKNPETPAMKGRSGTESQSIFGSIFMSTQSAIQRNFMQDPKKALLDLLSTPEGRAMMKAPAPQRIINAKRFIVAPDGSLQLTGDEIKLDENAVVYKDGDELWVMTIGNEKALSAMKGVSHAFGDSVADKTMKFASMLTRANSSVWTRFSIGFQLVNKIRDAFQHYVLLLSDSPTTARGRTYREAWSNIGKRLTVANMAGKNNVRYTASLGSKVRGKPNEDYQEYEYYLNILKQEGGVTNYSDLLGVDKLESIEREFSKSVGNGLRSGRRKMIDGTIEFFDSIGDSVELTSRVALLKALMDNGISAKDASLYVKDTMNFETKGDTGRILGAFYAFSTAILYDTRRTSSAMFRNKEGHIMFALLFIGKTLEMMLADWWGEDDEDGIAYIDKQPFYQASGYTNFVFGERGEGIKIPKGWGISRVASASAVIARRLSLGLMTKKEAGEKVLFDVVLGNFSPIQVKAVEGNLSNRMIQTLAPTVSLPVVQLASNTSFTGSMVYPNPLFKKDGMLEYESGYEWTEDTYKAMTSTLYNTVGVDIYPETLKLFTRAYVPMSTELMQTTEGVVDAVQGNSDTRPTGGKIPFVSKFNSFPPRYDQRIYRSRREMLEHSYDVLENAKRNDKQDVVDEYKDKNIQVWLNRSKLVDKTVKKIHSRADRYKKSYEGDELVEKLRDLEDEEKRVLIKFNRRFEEEYDNVQ